MKQENWWNDLLMFFGGIVAAVAVLWGKLREVGSQEKMKRADTDTANAQIYIGLGKDIIDDLNGELKELRTASKAHSEQLLTVWKEVHLYQAQAHELMGKVEQQTLRIQEQDDKIETQSAIIEALHRDNAALKRDNNALQQINRELMARLKNDMQKDIGISELLADVQVESSHLGESS